MSERKYKRRRGLHWAALFLLIGAVFFAAWQLVVHPDTPLHPAWNPAQPLRVTDPLTPLTNWKLARTLQDDRACLAALATGARFEHEPDFVASDQCHIRPNVVMRGAGSSTLAPFKTRCQTALRLAMWAEHGIKPLAQLHLKDEIGRITHFSSYNCRAMRTGRDGPPRMSTHATADAIDISGFVTGSGRRITLQSGWQGRADEQAFLRAVRDSACDWFRVTLGPDYNSLHADHFHLQHTGWGLCR